MPRTEATEMVLALLAGVLLLQTFALIEGEEGAPCYESTTNPTTPMELDEAVFLARCHTACVRKHVNETIALRMAVERHQVWPYVTTSDLQTLGRNCDTVEKVMECRRGCVTKFRNEEWNRTDCRESCYTACQHDCGSGGSCRGTYYGTSCGIVCKKNLCGGGCALVSQLPDGPVPSSPALSFNLTRTHPSSRPWEGGLYHVSTTESHNKPNRDLTTFIAQVELNGSNFYFPLMSLDDVLDLGHFTCESVNASFAAVNQHGVSDFSPPSQIRVYGETRLPSQLSPGDIQYEWYEDTNPEHERLAVVNISWERPEDHVYVSSYSIAFLSQSDDCGGKQRIMNFINIDKGATHFVWMPLPGYRLPVIGCLYQAVVQALPCQPETVNCNAQRIPLVIDTNSIRDVVYPKMNLTCHKYVNTSTGEIAVYAHWAVDNASRMIESIKTYQISVSLVDTKGGFPQILDVLMNKGLPANEASHAYVVNGLSPQVDINHKIIFRVTPAVNGNYSWRPIPDRQECLVNVYPKKPSIPSATVSQFFVNDSTVFLNLTLEEPDTPYGDIESYEVIVTRDPVPADEDPFGMNLVKRRELELENGGKNGILNAENVNSAYQHIDSSTACLFAQLRARNRFLWSEWSDPFLLERYPDTNPNCSAIEEPEHSVSLYTYVGGSAGAIVLVVVVVLLCFVTNTLCRRHRMRRDMKKAFKGSGYENPIFRRGNTQRRCSRGSLWLPVDVPKADDWELPSANILLTEEEPLGEGCFGLVHRGVVKGPILHSRTMKNTICMNVAIKFLKKSASGSERSDFLEEIETMKGVAEGNNPHVVNMIGCVTLQEPICLVTEFVKYGDLLTYLTTIRKMVTMEMKPKETDLYTVELPDLDAMKHDPENVMLSPLSPYANLGDVEPVNLISFAYQIASGMEYLASLNVVHRDLACRNILVGEGKQLKISDFGMARTVIMDEVYVKSSKGRLPWKWMAIESITNREFTTSSDVWAYGVSLWEIATLGGFPYPTIPNDELLDFLKRGNRLECPSNCSSEIYDIMVKCWMENPASRPCFSSLKTTFAEMLQENNLYIQFDNINAHNPYYTNISLGDETNGPKLSGNQLSDSESATFLSSSSSTQQETSSYELIKGNGADVLQFPSNDEQPPTLVPPNLYVDTPTKAYEKNGAFDMEEPELVITPTRLFVNTTSPEMDL